MDCRVGCGACCIAPSISSPLPGMPRGKPERPEVCHRLRASEEMCGQTAWEAFMRLAWMERATQRSR
jgi:Fe-S-cluster containining protein